MSELTVGELIERLEQWVEDHPEAGDQVKIRWAEQPSYPLQYHIGDLRFHNGILYIREASQVYETPYLPKSIFTEDEDLCSNCMAEASVGTVRPDPQRRARDEICRSCLLRECPQEVFDSYEGYLDLEELATERASVEEAGTAATGGSDIPAPAL